MRGCGDGMWPSPHSRPDVGSKPIQPAPGDIGLGPGMQIGEIMFGAGGAFERLEVGPQLNQVSGYEPRGKPR